MIAAGTSDSIEAADSDVHDRADELYVVEASRGLFAALEPRLLFGCPLGGREGFEALIPECVLALD